MFYGFNVEVIYRYKDLVDVVEHLAREKHVTYPKFYLRMILESDDVLVKKKYMERLEKLLRKHGYAIDADLREGLLNGYY